MLVNPSNYFKHETSIIDEGASIGQNTKIWHWTHISAGAVIGSNCTIGQNVFIANNVAIGNQVKIQNNVSVYDNVMLEDEVFCGPGMVFTNVYNPRAAIDRKNEYQSTVIKKGATLGANCTIVCGITIGIYAFIAAGAVVNKNVPDFALMMGVPARQKGWITRFGEKMDLPLTGTGKYNCPHTGDQYVLSASGIIFSMGLDK